MSESLKNLSELSDAKLAELVKSGNDSAFDVLTLRYLRNIGFLAKNILRTVMSATTLFRKDFWDFCTLVEHLTATTKPLLKVMLILLRNADLFLLCVKLKGKKPCRVQVLCRLMQTTTSLRAKVQTRSR